MVFPQVFCALEASPREFWNIIGILGPWRLCHLAATWWYYWWWPNPVLVDWSLRLFAKLQNTILYIPDDAGFDQHQHFKRFSMCTVNSQVLVSTAHPSLTCQAQWSESETQISSSKLWLNCSCWTPPTTLAGNVLWHFLSIHSCLGVFSKILSSSCGWHNCGRGGTTLFQTCAHQRRET